jgi:hypothetical protein
MGDTGTALRTGAEGLTYHLVDAKIGFRKAVVHRRRGGSSQASACWRQILTLTRPEESCSVDQGIYGHLTWRNLAMLAAERGNGAGAARLRRAVLAEYPGDCEALDKLRELNPECSATESRSR